MLATIATLVLLAMPQADARAQAGRPDSPKCFECGRPLIVAEPRGRGTGLFDRIHAKHNPGCPGCGNTAGAAGDAGLEGGLPPLPGQAPGASGAPPGTVPSLAANPNDNPGALSLGARPGTVSAGIALPMFGDISPIAPNAGVGPTPGPPGTNPSNAFRSRPVNTAARGPKFADNQIPFPVDRVFTSFNFFDYINQAIDKRFQVPLNRIEAYRYTFGFEKTFMDKLFSVGVKFPIDNVTATSPIPNYAGSSTAVGDVTTYFKLALWQDREKGKVLSAGVQVTANNGPNTFAGAKFLNRLHYAQVQPFIGFFYKFDKAYLIGFSAINVPMSPNDVTTYFNDLGVGYYAYQNTDKDALIRLVAPTFEVHVNTPLSHRDVFNSKDIAGTADVVDLTYGVSVGIRQKSLLSAGVVTPVTGPRPFSVEALVFYNFLF